MYLRGGVHDPNCKFFLLGDLRLGGRRPAPTSAAPSACAITTPVEYEMRHHKIRMRIARTRPGSASFTAPWLYKHYGRHGGGRSAGRVLMWQLAPQ